MGSLQLQLLISQLKQRGVDTSGLKRQLGMTVGPTPGPTHASYPGVPNELGIVSPPPAHRNPSIGPAPVSRPMTSGSSYPSYPNEMGMPMPSPAPHRGPTIGPDPTAGRSLDATMMAGLYPMEMGAGEQRPALPAAPRMPMPDALQSATPDMSKLLSQGSIAPTGGTASKPSSGPAVPGAPSGKELPFQTYQRLTGQRWSGGHSSAIQDMMRQLGVTGNPGSAETNLALQQALLANAGNIQG